MRKTHGCQRTYTSSIAVPQKKFLPEPKKFITPWKRASIFRYLTNPVAVKGTEDGHVCGIECVKMELGEPDASGRRRPVEVKDSNFVLDVDCVIMAIGTKLNTLILDTTENLRG